MAAMCVDVGRDRPSRSRSRSRSPHASIDIESSQDVATPCACEVCHARIHHLEQQIQDLRRRLRVSEELVNEMMEQAKEHLMDQQPPKPDVIDNTDV